MMMHWGVTPIIMPEQETDNWENMVRSVAQQFRVKLKGKAAVSQNSPKGEPHYLGKKKISSEMD